MDGKGTGREGFENNELDKKAEHVRKCENGVVIVIEYEWCWKTRERTESELWPSKVMS